MSNLVTSCRACNGGKGDVLLAPIVPDPNKCAPGQHEYGGEHTWYRRGQWHGNYFCRRCGTVSLYEMFPPALPQ